MEEQVAWAAVVSASQSVSSSVCVLLAVPGQNGASLSPAPAGRSGRGSTAMFFPNPSPWGSDTPSPIVLHGAVKHRGKNSQLPITCSDTKPQLLRRYSWLSPHLGGTWRTYVLFFLKSKALEHGCDRSLTNSSTAGTEPPALLLPIQRSPMCQAQGETGNVWLHWSSSCILPRAYEPSSD